MWATGQSSLFDNQTIVRVRGQLTASLVTVTSVLDGFARAAMGICVVSENAAGIGITAIPQPISDASWDGWLWHQWLGAFTGYSTTETGRGPMEAVRMEIDSKGMRKLRATDVIVGVIELGTEVGTAALQFVAETRVLIKVA